MLSSYLRYRKNAVGRHGVHSPFVYDLLTNVLSPQDSDDFSQHPAEDWRTECMTNNHSIEVLDFGTGTSGPHRISEIARRAAKGPKQGQLLHRIVRHFQPQRMLELGTSLGITTIYQATAAPFDRFITLEGCPQTAAVARQNFETLNLSVETRTGEFSETLPDALAALARLDYAYFDGNHQYQPTLDYFETCLPFAHNDSVFVFDDIHWSAGMEKAWETICAHESIRLSLDLFDFGLVFFRQEQKICEHFVLKV